MLIMMTNNPLDPVYVRYQNALQNFHDQMAERGFTRPESDKILAVYQKLKIVKLDPLIGMARVVHGSYMEKDVLRNAVNHHDEIIAGKFK